MSFHDPKPSIGSIIALTAGSVVVLGAIVLPMAFPRLHIGLSVTIGVILGASLLLTGALLNRSAERSAGAERQFWPMATELWGFLAAVCFFSRFLAPMCLFGALSYLLPTGDGWFIVAVRIAFLGLALASLLWWVRFADRTFPEFFRDRVSDEAFKHWMHREPAAEPESIPAAIREYWQLAVIAVVAFCVAWGVVDWDAPWLALDVGPQRFRSIVRIISWCRGNPNTVISTAWFVGIAATGAFAHLIFQAHKRRRTSLLKNGA